MTYIHPLHLEHERNRFLRPDAHKFLRPDWRRFTRSGHDHRQLYQFFERIERKYSPEQPRVPRGNPAGGQWTSEVVSGANNSNDSRIASDAAPDPIRAGTQYAQRRPRGGFASVTINGQQVETTPAQQARLTVVEAQARDAVQRVQELDPKWRPEPSAYESVEGLIGAYQSDLRQAQDRIYELQRVGVGPGPFAGGSIPASESVTAADRVEINRIGAETGCNTCGRFDPGTLSGNFVADHQPPTALVVPGTAQRLYPQCLSCSLRQGGWVNFLKRQR